jgi:hypothetical protein
MARPTVTIPPVTILMEMAGYGSLTEWLTRPLPKEHVKALSSEARRERKRAQVRRSKARKCIERALASMHDTNPTAARGLLIPTSD